MINSILFQFIKAAFITAILLFPHLAIADPDFGEDLAPILKTKLSFTNNKKQNLTVGKITLTNKRNKKTGQTIYSGLTLVVTNISDNQVSLSNPSGFTKDGFPFLLIPNTTPLAPQKTLKNIQLQFNNPSGKKFKFNYSIYGSLKAGKINAISDVNVASGTLITLSGENFTRASTIKIAGQVLKPDFISDQQLQFAVPFTINTKKQLISLKAGKYSIKVDNSSVKPFTVTDLPQNLNPPGQLLKEQINSTFQELTQIVPELQSNLPQLLAATSKEPNTQEFIQDLAELISYFNGDVETKINQLVGKVDARSLDTLERALLVNKSTTAIGYQPAKLSNNGQLIKSNSPVQNAKTSALFGAKDCLDEPDGDKWLECRQSDAYYSRLTNKFGSWLGYCAFFAKALPTNPITPVCALLGTATISASVIKEINVATHAGLVKGFELNINRMDTNDSANFDDFSDRKFVIYLNNYDNNEELILQTSNAKNILGATLYISDQPDWINIANGILSSFLSIANIKTGDIVADYITKKTRELFARKLNESTNVPQYTKTISLSKIKSEAGWLFGTACNIADARSIYLKTKENKWVIPDTAPNLSPGQFMHTPTTCNYKIADDYRLPSEKNIKSTVDFFVKRYPKLILQINGQGSVTYSKKPLSSHPSCSASDITTCTEYFDLMQGQDTLLGLTSNSSANWKLNDIETCSNLTDCNVSLNFNNDPIAKMQVAIDRTHWAGSYVIDTCTPLPQGAQWYWQNPCNAYFPIPAYGGKFYFDDTSPEVIFESIGYLTGYNTRSISPAKWSSSSNSFEYSINTEYFNDRSDLIKPISETGNLYYLFTVLTRTQSSIKGTFHASMKSGYFEQGNVSRPWHSLNTEADGAWEAHLVNTPKPNTQMMGYDICSFYNSGCKLEHASCMNWKPDACQF